METVPSTETVERGELLYQPDWARFRTIENPKGFYKGLRTSLLFVGLGLFLSISFGIQEWNLIEEPDVLEKRIGLVIGMALFSLFFATPLIVFLYKDLTQMPFRVYESGVASPKVPFRYGIRRRELFIPFEDVVEITLGSSPNHTVFIPMLAFQYERRGRKKQFSLFHHEVEGISDAEDILRERVPDLVVDKRNNGRVE